MNTAIADDRPYQHYDTKRHIVAWISQNLFDHLTYTVRHGLLKGMKRKGGLAWLPAWTGLPSATPEQEFWNSLDLRGLTVYDLGAFQGLLTLFFARQARQVVSYEPNAKNHARLMDNLRLNRIENVQVRKVGIGSKLATVTMVTPLAMPGGGSVEPATVEGLLNTRMRVQYESISIVTLDYDIRHMSLPAPDFIKIDIEGEELPALRGAQRTLAECKPRLFLEMHGETMNLKRKNVAAIVAYLNEFGYRDILHVESKTLISLANSSIAAQGHLYCQ